MTLLEEHLGEDRLRLFDVGARGGLDRQWRQFHPCLEVVGFEPDPEEWDRINRTAESLPYPARFLPYALWRETRDDVVFNVCKWPVASSVYEPNETFLRSFGATSSLLAVSERRRISTTTLDSVCRDEGLLPDCLKLDVEGAELDVLIGAEEAIRETLVIEVEVEFSPVFTDQPMFADVDAHLRERGWTLLGLRRNSWRHMPGTGPERIGYGGQLVAADALYWSREALGGELPLNRELKLCVILAAYLQSDLVLERLRSPGVARHLSDPEREELAAALVPRAPLLRRVAQRALRRMDSERRRALADALQPGDATVWQDPHFF